MGMIDKLITNGTYKFYGTVSDLKRLIGGFHITEVITDGEIQGINIFSAMAEFRYQGEHHRCTVSSEFSKEKILILEYKGRKRR